MGSVIQRLTIIIAISAIILAYLYHVPNSDGVPQMDRIRLLSASMKIVSFVGFLSETFGMAPAWYVQRHSGVFLKKFKKPEIIDDMKIEDTIIEGVPVRIYIPNDVENSDETKLHPAVIFYHGGAFYMGSVETHHPITRELARRTGFIVISVEYRLAPEHPFPAGLDDCLIVTKYFLNGENAQKYQIDAQRVAISGDSAGGNLAAVIAMKFVNNSISQNVPRLQVLIYPVVQFFDLMQPSFLTPSLQIFHFGRGGQVLHLYLNETISDDILQNNHTTSEQKKFYRRWVDWSYIPEKYRQIHQKPSNDDQDGNPQLIKNAKKSLDPDVSPLLVDDKDLKKLPRTYISTVDHDRLRDQGFMYAGRLKDNGVDVIHRHFENTFHGSLTFLDGPFRLDIAHEMMDDLVKYLIGNL